MEVNATAKYIRIAPRKLKLTLLQNISALLLANCALL